MISGYFPPLLTVLSIISTNACMDGDLRTELNSSSQEHSKVQEERHLTEGKNAGGILAHVASGKANGKQTLAQGVFSDLRQDLQRGTRSLASSRRR